MNKYLSWIESHPVEAGIGIVIVGAVLLYALGNHSGGSGSDSGAGAAAYYSAVSAEAQSGNALQAVQIQEQASTARTQIAADVATHSTDVNAATALAYAPFEVQMSQYAGEVAIETNLIGALGAVASQPGTTVTNVSHSNGFFGIGGGTKQSTTYVPNTAAISAGDTLNNLFGRMSLSDFYASH
jgi:hypothetical protein